MKRAIALASLAMVLQSCGGGGGGSTPSAIPVKTVATGASVVGTVSLSFANAAGASMVKRSPAFVSPAASTAALAVNGGSAQTYDVSATSTLCTTAGSTRTCALSFTAPIGQDSIAATLMSGGATPAILGQGSNSVTVVAGTPFSVTIGVNPIVASLAFTIGSTFTVGTAQSTSVAVTFVDPGGATITGSGNVPNFLVPVTLTSGDPHVTLTPSTLTTPGQSFTVAYDGSATTPASVTITAKVGTTSLASAPLTVQGLLVTRYNLSTIAAYGTVLPGQIITGPDGNIWWTERSTAEIGKIVPGSATNYPAVQSTGITHYTSVIGSFPTGIAAGGDGNIWYSNNSNTIARITTTNGAPSTGPGVVSLSGSGQIGRLATDSQGNVWYINGSSGTRSIGYVDVAGGTFAVHDYPGPPSAGTYYFSGLTLGADNAMWFTEQNASPPKIGRITTPANGTAGTYTEYTIPNQGSGLYPTDIAKGPDGNVWFSEFDSNSNAPNQFFAKFAPGTSISISEYPNVINPAAFANLVTMFAGGDGNMWIAEGGGAVKIPPAAPTTATVEFFTDNGQTSMVSCVAGPDQNNWCGAYGSPSYGPPFIATADAILTWKPR